VYKNQNTCEIFMIIKNRGATLNPEGRFEKTSYEAFEDGWFNSEEENLSALETMLFPEKAKTIITHNDSPDIGFDQSINPYRGCEHGCIYCYARPSHAYMNLSPGLDFETKIFFKENAAELLENELSKPSYICKPIIIGANTDPYQPIESKLKITRSILEVLHRYHHPVGLITKSSMIERDIDILADMAKRNLAKVAVSVTTLSNELKLILEPRTSGPKGRLRAVNALTQAGVPVRTMVAPIIPMINDKELEKILELTSRAGAQHASYVIVRLPYEVKDLFKAWLQTHFPDRAQHVMSIIKQMRGGKEYDSTFGSRMRGEGQFAQLIEARFRRACKCFQLNMRPAWPLNTQSFKRPNKGPVQLDLFGN
jgi:DNA repair photolyase